ncbi:MAG: glycosyltransferase [Clostridia bacterium]|nr:glycosyltransferase [Clostridia bacterium]
MDDLVSVIIPAYNAQKYIKKCIESVLNQTYAHIEIIIVNDGSKDDTLKICKSYAKNNSNVKIITTKNRGVSYARNSGINSSNGKYIVFIDSDDYVDREYISALITNYDDNKLTLCGYYEVIENINNKLNSKLNFKEKITGLKEDFYLLYNNGLINSNFCKLYLSNIIKSNEIKFDEEISIGEDLLFNLEYMKYVNDGFKLVELHLYYYVKRKRDSLSIRYNKDMLLSKMKIYNNLNDFAKSYFLENTQYTLKIRLASFNILISAASNEFHNKHKNLLERYISCKKLLSVKEVINIINIAYKDKLISYSRYFLLKNKMYLIYMVIKKLKIWR